MYIFSGRAWLFAARGLFYILTQIDLMEPTPEAFSRILIDKALEASGWNLLDPQQVRFEVHTRGRRADYVLMDSIGRVLCVLEAKREDHDPYDAKEQARGYAENLKAPFVILSNGTEHWFWNYDRADQRDAYRIERLPSPEDLERLRLKNLQPPRPLLTEARRAGLPEALQARLDAARLSDSGAWTRSAAQFDRRRQAQVPAGDGDGHRQDAAVRRADPPFPRDPQRRARAVHRRPHRAGQADDGGLRRHPARVQAGHLQDRAPHRWTCSAPAWSSRRSSRCMVDRRYREEFTPFYFDLVINDEAHRSIYGDAREVVQFFQATRVGLTATPKAYLKNINVEQLGTENPKALEARLLRDTYHYFGCEPGCPRSATTSSMRSKTPKGRSCACRKIFDIRSDITTKALDENGWAVTINEQEENFKIQDLERKIFTPDRNRVMCEAFLKHAQKDPQGKIGKSIIFAVNQTHATALTKILNELQPGIAVTITSRIPEASAIAKEFRDGKRPERIAVSVDMLSTGYNCRDLLNVVLMRPIFSPTEYIQIKGRGTRLFTFKIGNTEVREEELLPARFLRRGRILRGEVRLQRAAEVAPPRKEPKPTR